ncbi:serine/threonine-protein kinase [Rhodococcoides kyotonense]|uniref:non-specific serine/threonine protein kinase n=1 Tax=Rhodococcoides kyotonense TaxID=398843 RepID=A0A239G5U9_9NOCA|nr:serine/threonine-protein kinase [Rhodococcus kyotonensis]SNS63813.1 serine/threonine protein kinase [Rhodococcus kyotonensis]
MTPRLLPGETFAGYTVERLLGTGGMSEVYLVEGRETLKILNRQASQNERLRSKFVREAELAGQLHHPNIVSVHAHGEFDGQLWMSMHYVEGYSAARLVARGQIALAVGRAARIVSEVAKGLDYAHSHGILHRDVKPSNILISTEVPPDEREQILLSDWGIARLIDDDSPLVRNGTVLASIGYAAPELLRGESLSARTDIYALGATLVELLTGKTPYPLSTPVAIMDAQLNASPPVVTERRGDLPMGLNAVVATALAKNPSERYSTCQELSDAVAHAVATSAPATPPRKPRFGAGWRRRL